jgi:hypothetical protein
MARRAAELEVLGRSSLETSRRFGEGFTPAALASEPAGPGLRTVFCVEGDWCRAEAEATQAGDIAHPGQAVQRVQQVKGPARSLPSWSWSVARMPPMRCPATNAGWTPRSPSATTLAEVPEAWWSYRTWAAWGAARAAHRRDRRPLSHPARLTHLMIMP